MAERSVGGAADQGSPELCQPRAEAVQDSTQVQILIVPTFKIEQVQRGTTAGDIIRSKVYFCSLSALGCSARSPFVTS